MEAAGPNNFMLSWHLGFVYMSSAFLGFCSLEVFLFTPSLVPPPSTGKEPDQWQEYHKYLKKREATLFSFSFNFGVEI